MAETPNDASMTNDASPPDTLFDSRFPIVELTTKPRNGNSGISASMSPLQGREGIRVQRLAVPEQGDDQRQADRGFGRRHRDHEERDDLAGDVAVVAPERDEAQVDGVQHDLDREQDRDHVLPQEHAGAADGEQQRRHNQVVAERDHESPSRRASTTAPTMATRIRIEVASNANPWSVKSTRPNSRTELTVAAPSRLPTGAVRPVAALSAHPSCTTSSVASTAPTRAMPGRRSGCMRSHSAASSCGAFSRLTKNQNRT